MPPPAEPRFLVDENLHGLVRLLRLLGFDAVAATGDDDAIAARARSEGRRLLTRDRALAARSPEAWRPAAERPWAQLAELVAALELAPAARPFTRCMVCNAAVSPEVGAEQPARGAAAGDMWRCPGCGRRYWRGSHVARMERRLAAVLGDRSIGAAHAGSATEEDRRALGGPTARGRAGRRARERLRGR